MSTRYSDELRESIRNANFDEKVAILLHDSELPIAQVHEIAQALSRMEVTSANDATEEWTFCVRALVKASNILKEVHTEAWQNHLSPYGPETALMMMHHDMIARIWLVQGIAGILGDIAPQAVKSPPTNIIQMIETLSNAGSSLAETLEVVSSRPNSQSS
jgi:hypothetical protein